MFIYKNNVTLLILLITLLLLLIGKIYKFNKCLTIHTNYAYIVDDTI